MHQMSCLGSTELENITILYTQTTASVEKKSSIYPTALIHTTTTSNNQKQVQQPIKWLQNTCTEIKNKLRTIPPPHKCAYERE